MNNLCIIYDNNNITCDGTANVANAAEDVNAKMRATGWNVIDILNGHSNVSAIVHALLTTKASEKPTFANIRTVIGFGSGKAGSASVHGAAIGLDDIVSIKKSFGLSPEEHYTLPDEVYSFFEDVAPRGRQLEAQWAKTMNSYEQQFPELTAKFKLRVAGNMPQDLTKFNPRKEDFPKEPTATHKSAGLVGNPLSENMNNFLVGTADLTPSCNVAYTKKVDFQNPDLKTVCGLDGDYTGRYLHYGIREHAMAGITNGLCAFNKGTFLSVTSSFFMFYLYAAPSVRMATLQGLQQIHIATHDSIGTGEDGPTHQSIALATLYRAMPNLLYMRPCDSEEVAGAFEVAIGATSTPSIISLSRQALPQWPQSCHAGSAKGAYIFVEEQDFNVTIISTGSEMTFAMQTRDILKTSHNITAHVISFSVPRLFEQQSREYKQSVLRSKEGKPAVVIEAYAPNGWERYADASSRCGCLEI